MNESFFNEVGKGGEIKLDNDFEKILNNISDEDYTEESDEDTGDGSPNFRNKDLELKADINNINIGDVLNMGEVDYKDFMLKLKGSCVNMVDMLKIKQIDEKRREALGTSRFLL